MTKYLLARHGKTKMNKGGSVSVDRERSWNNVPLTREGELEAQKVGLQLRGKGIEHISASNLHRSSETARIISNHLGLHPKLDAGLRPWNLGDYAGKEMKQITPEIRDYAENKPDEPVPGGESFNQFKGRALKGVARHIRNAGDRRSLLVSHHRVERLLSSLKPDGSTNFNEFFRDGEQPGGVEEFDHDPRHLERIARKFGAPRGNNGESSGPVKPEVDTSQRGAISPPAKIPEHDDGDVPDVPAHTHNLALGGAHHLAKAGLITPEQHRQIKKKVRNAMLMRASLREV